MKIKEGFTLHKIGADNVILAKGSASMQLNGIIKLNGTGALLWEQIITNAASIEQLSEFLCDRFGISSEQAKTDVAEFVDVLRTAKCIEE